MAANDYGFSKDLIVETKVVDKDEHGFVRVTDATGENANKDGELRSFVEWSSIVLSQFSPKIVFKDDLSNDDEDKPYVFGGNVHIGITPFGTVHNVLPSKGDLFIEEQYESQFGLDVLDSNTYLAHNEAIAAVDSHLYKMYDIVTNIENSNRAYIQMQDLLESDKIQLERVDVDEYDTMYFKFDVNIIVSGRVSSSDPADRIEFVDIIHCITPEFPNDYDFDDGK